MYFQTPVQEASREGKLRLLMILATIYPEKFEGEKGQNLMKVTWGLVCLESLFGSHQLHIKFIAFVSSWQNSLLTT